MKILVIGSGGREHAIVWKLAQSEQKPELYCAPGNAGIGQLATCVPIKAMDIEGVIKFSKENAIDLVMVAPDDPLAAGMVDALTENGIRAFGPCKAAAQIEASKVFSKALMKKYNIPTATYEVFTDSQSAIAYLRRPEQKFPAVLKADGLALGKGVVLPENLKDAEAAAVEMLDHGQFGDSSKRIVIEEYMTGPEVTVLAFTDGKTVVPMVSSQDHKRAYDGDKGLNTGGMGAFSPSRHYTPEIAKQCMEEIFLPTVKALASEGIVYKGVIYFGLMLTPDGPRVVEYNARFGDPETQCILPRLKTDLIDIFNAVIDGTLDQVHVEWKEEACACVVMASGGYPLSYEKGYPISGLEEAEAKGVTVFHAGTVLKDGAFCNNGGRVLGVTALGADLNAALEKAYAGVRCIDWKDVHYRTDIGKK